MSNTRTLKELTTKYVSNRRPVSVAELKQAMRDQLREGKARSDVTPGYIADIRSDRLRLSALIKLYNLKESDII